MLREQFCYDSDASWRTWRQRSDISEKLERYRRLYADGDTSLQELDEFLLLIDQVHDQTAKRFELCMTRYQSRP